MSPRTALLLGSGLALVFLAALSSRAPRWLPAPVHHPGEAEASRVFHKAVVLHVSLVLASLALLFSPGPASPWFAAAYLAALPVLRWLGMHLSRRVGSGAAVFEPLLAPMQGMAFLVDWALAPLLRARGHADPIVVEQTRAYELVRDLTTRTVEQVMIPRSEVAWLPAGARVPEIVALLRRRPHSTFPVFDGDFEQVRGMVELTDLLGRLPEDATAADLVRPGVVVPETMGCDDLVGKMQEEGFTKAVVVDEFGAMAGLITLEDLLEVLLGDLSGEHESIPVRVRRLEDGAYLVDASMRIDEFEETFGFALPQGDYETLAGLYLNRVAHIPDAGEWIDVGPIRLEVAEASARRIRALRVSGLHEPSPAV